MSARLAKIANTVLVSMHSANAHQGNNLAELTVLIPGDCHSDPYEKFHPSTPVFEIDGDFGPLVLVAAMWSSTGSA